MSTAFWTSGVNIFLLLAFGFAAAQAGSSAGPQLTRTDPAALPTIISNLERAQLLNRAHIRGYTVTRDYKLYAQDEGSPMSQVIAEVTFQPPNKKEYEIRQHSGSGQGEKVVRKVLDHEQEMAKDSTDHDLNRRNYEFVYEGERELNGVRCYVLKITPKRDDKDLLDGYAWIDTATFLPRRISGTPSKNPSWWVKKLQVEMTYAPVDGMWLPTGSRADADIRLFGRHTFIGRDLRYEALETVAESRSPQRVRSHHRPFAGANAGTIILAPQ